MLKSNLERMYNSAIENKNMMAETIKNMYEPTIETHEQTLKEINEELEKVYVMDEDCETAIEIEGKVKISKEELDTILDNKQKMENVINKVKAEYEKDKLELLEVEKELEIKRPDTEKNLSTVHDAIDVLKSKLTEPDANVERINILIELLKDSIALKKLTGLKVVSSKSVLKKQYKDLGRQAHRKISMEKNYIFPSLGPVKNVIKEIISFDNRELTDKEVMGRTKVILAHFYTYIIKMNMAEEGLYLYYMLENLLSMENLPMEDQTTIKNAILSILDK